MSIETVDGEGGVFVVIDGGSRIGWIEKDWGGKYCFSIESLVLNSKQLREIADKLDELNNE